MSEPFQVYLAKAEESLLGAASELDQGRYDNSTVFALVYGIVTVIFSASRAVASGHLTCE